MSNFKKHINYHSLQLSHNHKDQKGTFNDPFIDDLLSIANSKKDPFYNKKAQEFLFPCAKIKIRLLDQ